MSVDKINLGQRVRNLDESPEYQPISCVRILAGTDSEGNQIVYTAGDAKSGRTIDVENRLIRDSDQGLIIANNILQAIQGYAYKPYKGSGAILDPAAEIGDGVSVDEVYSVLADIETTFSPLMTANIAAPEGSEIDHEYPYESSEDRAMIQEMAKTRTSFIVEKERIAGEISKIKKTEDGISEKLTSLELTVDGIHAYTEEEIQTISGGVVSNWAEENFTPEGISTQVSNYFDAKGAASEAFSDMRIYTDGAIAAVEGDYTSKIEQTAKSITQTVAAQESKWDTSELPAGVTISAWGYGKPTENGYPASAHAGEYYLNQSTGYYWYSDGTRWTSVKKLKLITSNLKSEIKTTADGILSTVSNTYATKREMSEISQKSDSITMSVYSDDWGQTTFKLYGTEEDGSITELYSQTLYLNVDAAHITGTIYANAVEAGTYIDSPRITGGTITSGAFIGGMFTDDNRDAFLSMFSAGGGGIMYYGPSSRPQSQGNGYFQVTGLVSGSGSNAAMYLGGTAMGSMSNGVFYPSGVWDFSYATVRGLSE